MAKNRIFTMCFINVVQDLSIVIIYIYIYIHMVDIIHISFDSNFEAVSFQSGHDGSGT